jgi:hypothetical protein
MSIKLPWQQRPVPREYIQPPMTPTERSAVYDLEPVPVAERTVALDFGDKPVELMRAADRTEWTRPQRSNERKGPEPLVAAAATKESLLTVAWQSAPPTVAGLWRYREANSVTPHMCEVVQLGSQLCVRTRLGDSARYTAVTAFPNRSWAGPFEAA